MFLRPSKQNRLIDSVPVTDALTAMGVVDSNMVLEHVSRRWQSQRVPG